MKTSLLETTQVFYDRMSEIEDDAGNTLEPDQVKIEMSFDFAHRLVTEMSLGLGEKFSVRGKTVSHWHPEGFIDYKFRINTFLPPRTFWVKVKR